MSLHDDLEFLDWLVDQHIDSHMYVRGSDVRQMVPRADEVVVPWEKNIT